MWQHDSEVELDCQADNRSRPGPSKNPNVMGNNRGRQGLIEN